MGFFQIRVNSVRYLEQGVTAALGSASAELQGCYSHNFLCCFKDRKFLRALNCGCDHSYTSSLEIHLTPVLRGKDPGRRNKLFNQAELQSQITKYI